MNLLVSLSPFIKLFAISRCLMRIAEYFCTHTHTSNGCQEKSAARASVSVQKPISKRVITARIRECQAYDIGNYFKVKLYDFALHVISLALCVFSGCVFALLLFHLSLFN